MVEKKDIEICFSDELNWINDENLRKKVVNIWKEAANSGNQKNIEDEPSQLLSSLTIEKLGLQDLPKIDAEVLDKELGTKYVEQELPKLISQTPKKERHKNGELADKI